MRQVHFHRDAFAHLTGWAATDPALFERLTHLIGEAARSPFEGIGKPEPLKHRLKGYWSRRINAEHRLVPSGNGARRPTTAVQCSFSKRAVLQSGASPARAAASPG